MKVLLDYQLGDRRLDRNNTSEGVKFAGSNAFKYTEN